MTPSWSFWVFWGLAFLGFPLGGLLASFIVGPVATPLRAGVAGAITGAVLGLVQWLVLRSQLPVPAWWILATSFAMSLGLAVSVGILGTETGGNELLWRALVTGACIGLAQWLVLQSVSMQAWVWIVVVAMGWPLGWWITRSAGVDLSPKWSVFGSTGAWAFQFLTGLALYFLFRSPPGLK
ncbi:MAG: hypothetical protein ACT4QE_17965 [Anaerolineales bacterium]